MKLQVLILFSTLNLYTSSMALADQWKAKAAFWKLQERYQVGDSIPVIVLIQSFAKAWNIEESLLAAQATIESNWDVCALSKSGAQGIFQVLPSTARGFLKKDSYFDPIDNAFVSTWYLNKALSVNGNNVMKALAFYHGGPNKRLHKEKTANYVAKVFELYNEFSKKGWLRKVPISIKRQDCSHLINTKSRGASHD
ncbi:MAG: lytic transglycosylase domain-containing protein [Colwellia sp.]|nr:lytic transglycosylase domain-containing protein [Colwellia sp.]